MLFDCFDYFGFNDCYKPYNHFKGKEQPMRKLTTEELNRIWSKVKKLHKEREIERSLNNQKIEYDVKRYNLLVRRRDSKFTCA